jgi:hypothetical protein
MLGYPEKPWFSAVRRLKVNKGFLSFASAVPLLQSARLRERRPSNRRRCRPVGEILVSMYSLPYQRHLNLLVAAPLSGCIAMPMSHQSCAAITVLPFDIHDRSATSSFGRIGGSRRQCSALPLASCLGHANDGTCQSRWLLVAAPRSQLQVLAISYALGQSFVQL